MLQFLRDINDMVALTQKVAEYPLQIRVVNMTKVLSGADMS